MSVKMAATVLPKLSQGFKGIRDLRKELHPGLGLFLPFKCQCKKNLNKETMVAWQSCHSVSPLQKPTNDAVIETHSLEDDSTHEAKRDVFGEGT